ncbi:helix-turn-helix domain-containing protein [Clostridium bowmanii]|uniref:helix-turn-helix domain-containing protein n=1 Tax=Clostridium bowmanii TaxID=132925 RepID=UPI001C0D1EEC|nr:helix-turn-helix transcriptional regulator [Clostridium bowmanii]MBU3188722.1 helix-turn-helix domain-containing protein [Clostridium bowmanii]MCA1073307.1 helix-turn-helix domain-containing protein [Clostridium bowmanii]
MLGDNIKRIRKSRKLGLNELAKKSDISGSYLSNIEKGIKTNPSIDALNNIAKALGISVDELFKNQLDFFEELGLGEDNHENEKHKPEQLTTTLEIIPEVFTDPIETRYYISKHKIFSAGGFNVNKLSDDEVLEFGNALLEQMKMVSYKYKK